jgi:integrase
MAESIKFTEARVKELRSRVRLGRVEFQDEEVPALRLRVSPTSASWSVLKRIPGGAMARVLLGKADDIPAGEARKLAKIRIGEMQQGVDPNAAKRERRAVEKRDALTLAEGWEIYKAEKDLRPATVRTYERDLRTTFGDFWERAIADLTPEVVRNRHRDRKTRVIRAQARVEKAQDRKRITASPSRADGAVRALRAVVRYLRVTRGLDLPDVAAQIVATKSWGNVGRRKRALLGERLVEFVSAIRALGDDLPPDLTGTQRDLTLFLLCTALRWSSAAGLQWSEVDFKGKCITVPADRMKGKAEHSLPLGPEILAMLQARRAQARSKLYVFPGLDRLADGKGVHYPLGRLSERFLGKIKNDEGEVITWSPHDLRRTALTVLESMDVSAFALKRIAAHSQDDVTAGYLADDVERLRTPMERLEAAVLSAKAKGNVIPLKGKNSGKRR